jgi:hypothetical protein
MTDLDRRKFLTATLASLGLAATSSAGHPAASREEPAGSMSITTFRHLPRLPRSRADRC